jgi:uncharacterized membrane protein
MKAIRSVLLLVLVIGATLWAGGAAAVRLGSADPRPVDSASLTAVRALVTEPADRAALTVPAGFSTTRGYRPTLRDGLLVNPHGGCSSPVPLPRSFLPGCQRHDLGYDLLRHAAAVGHPLPASARHALDNQLATSMRSSCTSRALTPASKRLECTTWAGVASAAVWVNSLRQGWSVPARESVASIAEGGGALGTVGATSVLLVGRIRPARRRLLARGSGRRAPLASLFGRRAPLASLFGRWVSHAGASGRRVSRVIERAWSGAGDAAPRVCTTTSGALAAYASFFPGFLPRSALLQALATVVFVLPTLALVRRFRPQVARCGRTTRVAVSGLAGALLGAGFWWADAQQDAQRVAAGVVPSGVRYWLVVASVVAATALLAHVVRWLVRHPRRVWRPAVALAAVTALAAPAAPAHATAATPGTDRVLNATSPVGAVRAYGQELPHESLHERAERVADDLVARGGLSKSRVVIMVPTGSGWVDPAAVDGFERRFGGDVALVGMQYAATPSWVAYLFQRASAEQGARELASAVADRVDQLPVAERPQLHLYGESLGALAGQAVLADPVQAQRFCSALWVGSPGGATAGHGREVSVANASDPVVHATPGLLLHPTTSGQPWLPGVSYLQSAFDFVGSLSLPSGHGHRYGAGQAAHLSTC